MNYSKSQVIAAKILMILVLAFTFYFGLLKGMISYSVTGTFDGDPLLSGVMTGMFMIMLYVAPKVFKL